MFTAKPIEEIEKGEKYWNYQNIGVFDGETKIGEYKRNYSSFMKTFYPFKKNGNWYALYSSNYTATRIMSLPDCKDIGGEEKDTWGFCPVEYYIPEYNQCSFKYKDTEEKFQCFDFKTCEECAPLETQCFTEFGFIAGCVWGDDSSWKIQYLDLSQADKGIIKREDKFGYIELLDSLSLKESISMRMAEDKIDRFEIATARCYDLGTGWIK